jgi:quinoprotein glucose dehydrogenase
MLGDRSGWVGALLLAAIAASADPGATDWPYTEGRPGGGRYSPLADITPENVASLRVAWTYHHGDSWRATMPPVSERSSASESTPIVVDGRLFFTTPRNRVIALDPETGRELWAFDPKLERGGIYANMWINRGVAYWRMRTRRVHARRACSSPRSTRA